MIPLSWSEVSFASQWAFFIVLIVALLPVLGTTLQQLRSRHSDSEFVSPEMRVNLTNDSLKLGSFHQHTLFLLWLTAIFLSLALTRPQWGILEETVQQKGLDIVIAVDLSSSMNADDLLPSRIENARRELAFLIEELEGNRIGLVGFAGSAFLFCPLTLDTDAVEMFLEEMRIEAVPVPGTALGDAIKVAAETFKLSEESNQGSKVLLLLTDGEDHESQPLEMAKKAAEAGITIDTVGIGTSDGALVPDQYGGLVRDKAGEPVLSKLDGTVLRGLAEETGGMFLRLDGSSGGLESYLKELLKRETRSFGESRELKLQERFGIFLALAALCFFLSLVFEEVGKRR